MCFDLHSWKGAGDLRFGMSQAEVRQIAGRPVRFFKRGNVEPTDLFESIGLFAIYDQHGKLQALEFAAPAAPTLEGVDLLSIPFARAKQLLRLVGGDIYEGVDQARSSTLGIGLWAPASPEDPAAPCESVIACRRNYFDDPPWWSLDTTAQTR